MGFKKKKEDFVCGHCGQETKGTGYSNHCPQCLWSKHVDIEPGDRASLCGGMMKPIDIEGIVNHYVLVHKCEKCHQIKRNKMAEDDSIDAVLGVIKEKADKQAVIRPRK